MQLEAVLIGTGLWGKINEQVLEVASVGRVQTELAPALHQAVWRSIELAEAFARQCGAGTRRIPYHTDECGERLHTIAAQMHSVLAVLAKEHFLTFCAASQAIEPTEKWRICSAFGDKMAEDLERLYLQIRPTYVQLRLLDGITPGEAVMFIQLEMERLEHESGGPHQ